MDCSNSVNEWKIHGEYGWVEIEAIKDLLSTYTKQIMRKIIQQDLEQTDSALQM